MGCDIHLIVERKVGRFWHRVMEVPEAAQDPWYKQQATEAQQCLERCGAWIASLPAEQKT